MAKINKWVKDKGRKDFINKPVGDPEEIDRIVGESGEIEFNPVKSKKSEGMSARELLEAFVSYFSRDERHPHLCIKSFLELYEIQESQESGIKRTASYDNARLEYMRMQIGPVQNFYTTLGNILLSFDERLRRLEEEYASKKL